MELLRAVRPLKAALVLLLALALLRASVAIDAKRHACSLHHFMCKDCDPELLPAANASATPIRRLLAAGDHVAPHEGTTSGLHGKRYALNRHHHGLHKRHHSASENATAEGAAEGAAEAGAEADAAEWEKQYANWTSALKPARDAQARRMLKEKFMGRGR